MIFEIFVMAAAMVVVTNKDAREVTLGAILITLDLLVMALSLIFGPPKDTSGRPPVLPPRPIVSRKTKPTLPAKRPPTRPSRKSSKPKIPSSPPPSRPEMPKKENLAVPQVPVPPRPSKDKEAGIRAGQITKTTSETANKESQAKVASPTDEKSKAQKKIEKLKKKRENAELEMVDCEKSYIESLETLLKVYQEPMKLQRKTLGLEEKNLTVICSPMLQMIITLHTTILEEFKKHGGRKCGEVLNEKAPYFKMYTQYLNGYDAAIDAITENRRKNRKFEKFLSKQRKGDVREKRKWKYMDIASYLIMPVQRIPRYELLLKEIIKNTPEGDPELPSLNKALVMVREAAQHNNASMKSYQDVQKIVQIQSMLMGELREKIIQPHRVLCATMEGDVTMLSEKEAKEMASESCYPSMSSATHSKSETVPTILTSRSPRNLTRVGSSRSMTSPRVAETGGSPRLLGLRKKGERTNLFSRRKSSGSNPASWTDFRTAMEEKVNRFKALKMVEEACDIFVFSDLLVWVAKDSSVTNRQGYLELDEGVEVKDMVTEKDGASITACLVASLAANMRILFPSIKKLNAFSVALTTAIKHVGSMSGPISP
ncbi:hypothetical protein AAMO2058_000968000 [Amorphochlora amoebiformis]|uniref:DH domain-containing protein n=1 Tax=Amorphochlora amoebiformis TaxID=1561963 RepID=A0A6T6Z543_9EUKA|mmetsp:Transcript_8564/g.13433  ORF Transcript_8564/g.13433 Transcript_8564/m.13433 type:complete len:599 (+) Transcript_8564:125-1921(+)